MAILFKQPKRQERIFIWAVIIFVTSTLFLISFFIFPPFPKSGSTFHGEIFERDNAKIDLSIASSEEVRNLELFSESIKTEFIYNAKDKNGKQVEGKILATDKNEAISIIENKGLTVLSMYESYSTKNNPFSPYY